jgi:hypothetical protein
MSMLKTPFFVREIAFLKLLALMETLVGLIKI